MSAERATALRSLPSVDKLLRQLAGQAEIRGLTRARLTSLVRETLDKLPLPEDVVASVDVDPYQLL